MDLLLFSVILFAGIVPPGVIACMGYFASKKLSTAVLAKADSVLLEAKSLADEVVGEMEAAETNNHLLQERLKNETFQKIAGIEVRIQDQINVQINSLVDVQKDENKRIVEVFRDSLIKELDSPERTKALTSDIQKALKHQINGLIGADVQKIVGEMEGSQEAQDMAAQLQAFIPGGGNHQAPSSAGERVMNAAMNKMFKYIEEV